MPEELITLPSAGALPGIPGEHAAGVYLVDWEARTIRPAYATQPLDAPLQGDLEAGPLPENTLAADQSGNQA